jgi:O-antigen/teichoic acid export membrane protein
VAPPLDEARSLWRQGRVYALGNVLERVVAFLLLPVLVHTLTPAEWGVYAIMVATGQLLMVVPAGLLDPFLRLYFERDDPAARHRVVSTAFGLLLGFSLLVAMLAWPIALGTADLLFGSREHARAFLVGNLAVAFALAFQVELDYLRLVKRAGTFVAVTLLRSLGQLALAIFLVVVGGQGVLGMALASLLATAAAALTLGGWILTRTGIVFHAATARAMLGLGLPLAPAWLARGALETVERTLLQQFASTAALGLFSLAQKLADQLRLLLSAPLASVWGVRVMEAGDAESPTADLHRVLLYATVVLGAAAVALGLFGPEIVGLIAAAEFGSAASLLPLLALAQLIEPLHLHFESVLLERKWNRVMPLVHGGTLLVSAAALLLLVPRQGVAGAAVAVVLAQGARLAVLAALARRASVPARRFPWGGWWTIVALAAAATGSGVVLAGGRTTLAAAAVKVALCASFLALALLGPAFTASERRSFVA